MMKISDTGDQLIATIKKKPNWFILLLTSLWSIGWLFIMGSICYGLVTDPEKLDAEITLFLVLFFLAELFVFKIFLWHLKGHEKITIDAKELRIERKGTILTLPRIYEMDFISHISHVERQEAFKYNGFWFGSEQVAFTYLGQKKYFGRTLTISDATKIIDKINVILKAKANK